MKMSESFKETKEVKLEEFIDIWFQGGEMDIGNQYLNMNKYNYLEYIDNAAIEKFDELIKARDEFIDSLVEKGECFRYPLTFKNKADEQKCYEMLSEIEDLQKSYKNIKKVFDAGWVTQAHHIPQRNRFTEKEVQPLPEDWDEVYLVHQAYPVFKKVLVARNNHDRTVQLFRY